MAVEELIGERLDDVEQGLGVVESYTNKTYKVLDGSLLCEEKLDRVAMNNS